MKPNISHSYCRVRFAQPKDFSSELSGYISEGVLFLVFSHILLPTCLMHGCIFRRFVLYILNIPDEEIYTFVKHTKQRPIATSCSEYSFLVC